MGSSHLALWQTNIRNGTFIKKSPAERSPNDLIFFSALLDRTNSNVIVPNYTNSSSLYTVLYQEVARKVGNFLKKEEIRQSNTHVVGSSLGAQIAGLLRRRAGFRPRIIYGAYVKISVNFISIGFQLLIQQGQYLTNCLMHSV